MLGDWRLAFSYQRSAVSGMKQLLKGAAKEQEFNNIGKSNRTGLASPYGKQATGENLCHNRKHTCRMLSLYRMIGLILFSFLSANYVSLQAQQRFCALLLTADR